MYKSDTISDRSIGHQQNRGNKTNGKLTTLRDFNVLQTELARIVHVAVRVLCMEEWTACPAKEAECRKYFVTGHYAVVCRPKKALQRQEEKRMSCGEGGGGETKKNKNRRKVCLRRILALTDPHPPQPDSGKLAQSPRHGSTLPRVHEWYRHKQREITPSKPHGRWPHVCRRFTTE